MPADHVDTITVGIGDCRVSGNSHCSLVTHALGSCVAVAIHDPVAAVGGLLHVMLPDSTIDPVRACAKPMIYADTGIPALFHAAYAKGADKKRLKVWLVGGAQVADPSGYFNIGKRNYLACRNIFWSAGVLIYGEEVGGKLSRTVRLDVGAGRLWWNTGSGTALEVLRTSVTNVDVQSPAGAHPDSTYVQKGSPCIVEESLQSPFNARETPAAVTREFVLGSSTPISIAISSEMFSLDPPEVKVS